MKEYSCEIHIDQALERFIEKEGKFPIMNPLTEEEKLSTTCTQCKKQALYIVANK